MAAGWAPLRGLGLTGNLGYLWANQGGTSLFYTGRKDLALGVQVIARQFAVTPDVKVSWNTQLSEIGPRYYWWPCGRARLRSPAPPRSR